MSLEQLLQANTEALYAVHAQLARISGLPPAEGAPATDTGGAAAGKSAPAPAAASGTATVKAAAKAPAAPGKTAAASAPAAGSAAAAPPASTAAAGLASDPAAAAKYYSDQVKPALLGIMKTHGSPFFLEMLKTEFGVERGPELTADQFEAVVARCAALTAEKAEEDAAAVV